MTVLDFLKSLFLLRHIQMFTFSLYFKLNVLAVKPNINT